MTGTLCISTEQVKKGTDRLLRNKGPTLKHVLVRLTPVISLTIYQYI
jgi:hypothetical protein